MRKTIGILAIQCILISGFLFGQIIVSSIVGSVADPSGALVPNAQITVKNVKTGISVTATAGSDGAYSVPGLLAGTYEVTVTAPGFDSYKATGITLLSAQTARVNATLLIGSANQVVTVTDTATLLHTDDMSVSGSIATEQLDDLPTSIQTIDAAIQTAPGFMPYGANPDNGTSTPAIGGGTHWGSVNFTLNGMEVNDPVNSGAVVVQGTGSLVLPPPSSLQELNVQSADMTAQYAGHSTVTLVTKAGTNQFHGEAYEFLQNTDLNANTYALNAKGAPRDVDHLNQFGGNVGGPMLRDKAFFFADFNGYRSVNSDVAQLNLPSTAMRSGDFSALCTAFNGSGSCTSGTQLYNPLTGQPFANNQIPSSLITSQAKTLLTYLPQPTVANSPGLPNENFNYVNGVETASNIYGSEVRIDYKLSSRDSIYGVYAQRVADPWGVTNANYPNNYGQTIDSYSERNVSASETHTFNPNTINEIRAAFGDYATRFSGQNLSFDPSSLWPQNPASIFHGLPTITITSEYSSLFHDYGTGLYTPRKDVEFNDDFTHIQGRHNFQAGIDETGYKIWDRVPAVNNVTGLFTFSGNWTGNKGWPGQPQSGGNPFADFLLGVAATSQTSATGNFASWFYTRYWGAYAQDTWQASPRLTVLYGLRFEYQTPWHQPVPQQTSFDPVNDKLVLPENSATASLPSGAQADLFAAYPFETSQSIGLPTQFNQSYGKDFAPRLGFAFRPFADQKTVVHGGFGLYYNFIPAAIGGANEAFNAPWTVGLTQSFTSKLPAKPTTTFLPDITFSNPYPSVNNKSVVTANPTVNYIQRNFRSAVSAEWNLTIEQQIKANWVARISYLGNTSSHLPYNGVDYNGIVHQQPNVIIQNQRPYQPFGKIASYLSVGREEFNQLQLGLLKRFSRGSLFQAEYQYTRSLDDVSTAGGPNVPFDYMGDWGNSDGVRRHWAVFNYDYQLPFGRGRTWLGNSNAWTDAVVGGWQISGITAYGTGVPLINTVFTTTGTKYSTDWVTGRPDRVPGVPLYAGRQSGHNITKGVQWFNPAAFAPPAPFAYGNSARNMLFGPGYWNWDMSAMKAFTVRESVKLQFRADFLDAFNHMNLMNPNVSLADTRDGAPANAKFGMISTGNGNRNIQLALKLMF